MDQRLRYARGALLLNALVVLPCAVSAQTGARQPAAAETTYLEFSEVPLHFEAGRLAVPVHVGRDTLLFIIDLAAGATVISQAVRQTLPIDPATVRRDTIVGAGGMQEMETVGVAALRVGGAVVPDLRAVVVDLRSFRRADPAPPYGGILGLDFLRHFDLDIDLPQRRLRLYSRRAGNTQELIGLTELRRVDAELSGDGFVTLPGITINGTVIRTLVDTGAATSVLNWHGARAAGVTPTSEGVRPLDQSTGGIGAGRTNAHTYRFSDINLHGTSFGPAELRIADLPVFELIGMGDAPGMLLGTDLIRDCRLFISYSTGEAFVCAQRTDPTG